MPAIILIFFVLFFLPAFLKAKIFTSPEFLEKRYNTTSRLILSGLFHPHQLIDRCRSLTVCRRYNRENTVPLLPFLDDSLHWRANRRSVYRLRGVRAVVLNDVVQAAFIVIGGTILTILTFQEVESWEAVKADSPDRSLQLIHQADDPVMPWPGVLTGVPIIGIYFWSTNQFVIQRAVAAKIWTTAAGAPFLPVWSNFPIFSF